MKKRILCKAAAAVFYLMLPWMALTCQAGENVISEGVFINGVDVSGMTAAEAETVVQQQVQALSDSVITLTMDEDQESRTWGELGFSGKIQILLQRSAIWEPQEILYSDIKNRRIFRIRTYNLR